MTKEMVICLVLAGALILLNFDIVTDLHRTIDEQAETTELLETKLSERRPIGFYIGDHVRTTDGYNSYFNESLSGDVVYIKEDVLTIRVQDGNNKLLNIFWAEDANDFVTTDQSDWEFDRCRVNTSVWDQMVSDVEDNK